MSGYAVFGSWHPNTPEEIAEVEADPYITRVGVTPDWVVAIRRAAEECLAGHPAGLAEGRRHCARFGCQGTTTTTTEENIA